MLFVYSSDGFSHFLIVVYIYFYMLISTNLVVQMREDITLKVIRSILYCCIIVRGKIDYLRGGVFIF